MITITQILFQWYSVPIIKKEKVGTRSQKLSLTKHKEKDCDFLSKQFIPKFDQYKMEKPVRYRSFSDLDTTSFDVAYI